MIIDHYALKDYLSNHLDAEITGEGVYAKRFTDEQLKVYAESDGQLFRARCASGVCIDLLTNSNTICLTYRLNQWMKKYEHHYIDLFVDGIRTASERGEMSDEIQQAVFELPESNNSMRRVTIYLPHNAWVVLSKLTLSKGANVEKAPARLRKLICFGDSITQGILASRPSNIYPVQLANACDMQVLNQGVGGYVFNSRSLGEGLPFTPDLMTVAYGSNDWNRCDSLTDLSRNASEYIARLHALYPNTKTIVMTPIWRLDQERQRKTGSLAEVGAALKQICESYPNITVLDGLQLFPHDSAVFGDDKAHPNDEGFLHYALQLFKEVRTLI